jgi:GNAT superfamily N-acetyltransferase
MTTDIIYRRCAVKDLSASECKTLKKMNLGSGGMMREAFKALRKGHQGFSNIITNGYIYPHQPAFVVIAESNGEVCGWVLAIPVKRFTNRNDERGKHAWEFHFYVKKKYRKRGIGRQLFKIAARHRKLAINVAPHDDASSRFFAACQSINKHISQL